MGRWVMRQGRTVKFGILASGFASSTSVYVMPSMKMAMELETLAYECPRGIPSPIPPEWGKYRKKNEPGMNHL